MDNVVQNINIEDIIPSNFKPTNEEKRKIDELAVLIKQFGLLDPILVRPKNGKYEIILGMDKYQAALIANQNMVPVIVKEVDDEIYSKYSNIDTNNPVSLNTSPKETFSKKEKNSDVVNLSELSKIKLEYERDDLKMNNGQLNNNMMNNNFEQTGNQTNQTPTFGGRFFPSLEDEPTNMNMMGGINSSPTLPEVPNINNNMNMNNNNLIDLTDLSIEKEPPRMPTADLEIPAMNVSPIEPMPTMNINQPSLNNFSNQTTEPPVMPTQSDTIINLDNLQNNNPSVQPVREPVSMETLAADFGAPSINTNQFNNATNMDFKMPQDLNSLEPQNTIQSDFGLNQSTMTPPTSPATPTYPQSTFNTNSNFGVAESISQTPISQAPSKDVTPVTSTIKSLASSLEKFGYKINITEEDLPTISKITIEIEK